MMRPLLGLALILSVVLAVGREDAHGGAVNPVLATSHWQFDEAQDATPNDTAQGNDGMLVNGATYQGGTDLPPADGNVDALSLDGVDDYGEVPDALLLDFGGATGMTISVWVKPAVDPGGEAFWHVLGKRGDCMTPGTMDYQLAAETTNQLHFNSSNGGVVSAGVIPAEGMWTHVAATYDGVSELRLYVNGALAGTNDAYTMGPANDEPLRIGASGNCGNTFPGLLDEVCFWKRALHESQVAMLALGAGCDVPDGDGDGIPDTSDDCISVSDPMQEDADGDLAGDICEAAGSGNVDCNSAVNSVDALKVLRHSAALSVAQTEPCLNIGQPRSLPDPELMGDVDCSGAVNSVDALLILRSNAALSVSIPPGCVPIDGPPQPAPALQVDLLADGDDADTDFEEPEITSDGSDVTFRVVIDNDGAFPATIMSILDGMTPRGCLDAGNQEAVGMVLAADDGDAGTLNDSGPDAVVCTYVKTVSGGMGVQIISQVTAFAQGAGPAGGNSDLNLVIIG